MRIYCFGNEFVKEDSLAKEIADRMKIKGIEFVRCIEPEELPLEEEELVILDVAEGINNVVVLDDLEMLKTEKCVSCHDLDLSFHLKLLKETGSLKKVKIIAIPQKGDKKKIVEELKKALSGMK
ncbi:MAG: hypothetical protein KJ574_02360 [Nanoarchaeota archaeon]|nr:hypothetical protein [Nanoarchaeota archaeon]